ncbi:MAG: aminotransferase class V-fold PLP-dependent enzyme [Candidatus Delongbacteria bacterium]|nr:aminotransferase class V-fold PLP-dependent enzyme [Candidatus Delongbacteria bacterium]MBN2836216.1 aminotransferase class V-fold PLP-dependent enzyme [Candidatus Delongbacteria bacterium]
MKALYFDNAATSFPKPESVYDAVNFYMKNIGGNSGRSGHRLAVESGRIIFETRLKIADYFGISNPMNVIFTLNCTHALNYSIFGLIEKGDTVICSNMEHNSVIRPLRDLEKRGYIDLNTIPSFQNGMINLDNLENILKIKKPGIVVFNHASNVNGTVQEAKKIISLCKKYNFSTIMDCAQSAGIFDFDDLKADIFCFAGHKGFYGPTGTGGIVISDDFDIQRIKPHVFGGTGSLSEKEFQPDFFPDKLESGTMNISGIAGLSAGMDFIKKIGSKEISKHKMKLQDHFIRNIENIPEITHYNSTNSMCGVISFNVKNKSCSEVSQKLSDDFNIMSRAGLHCGPMAHKTLGSFPNGTVRFSFNVFNTEEEIDFSIKALKNIISNRK